MDLCSTPSSYWPFCGWGWNCSLPYDPSSLRRASAEQTGLSVSKKTFRCHFRFSAGWHILFLFALFSLGRSNFSEFWYASEQQTGPGFAEVAFLSQKPSSFQKNLWKSLACFRCRSAYLAATGGSSSSGPVDLYPLHTSVENSASEWVCPVIALTTNQQSFHGLMRKRRKKKIQNVSFFLL